MVQVLSIWKSSVIVRSQGLLNLINTCILFVKHNFFIAFKWAVSKKLPWSVECLELAFVYQNTLFITWIEENIWKFLNKKQQIEASAIIDKEEYNRLCELSCLEVEENYLNDKNLHKQRKRAAREKKEAEDRAYCILAEENDKHEEMYYDDLVYRYVEKEEECSEICFEEDLIQFAEEAEFELNLDLDRENDECDSSWNKYFYRDGWRWCKCSRCSAYREAEPMYRKLAEENEELEEMYYDDLVERFMEKKQVRSSYWNDHFDYCDGWKCISCESQRKTEAYRKLAEENEELEAMYFDDLAYRSLEKDEEVCSEEELIHIAETKIEMDLYMTYYNINSVPLDCLQLILKPFQRCEESYMMSLVCRRWNSVIEFDPNISLTSEILYFAKHGQFNVLGWYRYSSV